MYSGILLLLQNVPAPTTPGPRNPQEVGAPLLSSVRCQVYVELKPISHIQMNFHNDEFLHSDITNLSYLCFRHHKLTNIFVFQAEIDKTTNAGGKYRIDKRLVSTSIVNIDEIIMPLQSASTM